MQLDSQKLGNEVRTLRLEIGWSLSDLAEKSRITKGFLSNFERGVRGISLEQLGNLSDAFGVPPSFLLALAQNIDSVDVHFSESLILIQSLARSSILFNNES